MTIPLAALIVIAAFALAWKLLPMIVTAISIQARLHTHPQQTLVVRADTSEADRNLAALEERALRVQRTIKETNDLITGPDHGPSPSVGPDQQN